MESFRVLLDVFQQQITREKAAYYKKRVHQYGPVEYDHGSEFAVKLKKKKKMHFLSFFSRISGDTMLLRFAQKNGMFISEFFQTKRIGTLKMSYISRLLLTKRTRFWNHSKSGPNSCTEPIINIHTSYTTDRVVQKLITARIYFFFSPSVVFHNILIFKHTCIWDVTLNRMGLGAKKL